MKPVPLTTDQSPLVLLDLLFKLKVRDVMTSDLATVRRGDSMRDAQRLMKERGVTGLPVAEEGRLFGVVSVDDLIRALEAGRMDEPVERHMATNVVVLEEDMPLSFGASYFDKYRFGRFPVLSRENRLVGILTTRDVNASLLVELYKEYNKLERQVARGESTSAPSALLNFNVKSLDFENAGKSSFELKRLLTERGVDPRLVRRASVAAYEMEMNLVVHSVGGLLVFKVEPDLVEIVARDSGPGIENVEQAMEEGYTTANEWIKSLGFGAGMGLPNIKRVSDEFAIESRPGRGTSVRVRIHLGRSPASPAVAPEGGRP